MGSGEQNLWGEIQPVHVETRVRFVVHGSSLMLCGEGWVQPRTENQSRDVTCIKLDLSTLFEATEHGVETESTDSLTIEALTFWLDNFLIFEIHGEVFANVFEGEFEVLK